MRELGEGEKRMGGKVEHKWRERKVMREEEREEERKESWRERKGREK